MQQLGGRVLMAVEFSSYAAVSGKGTYGSGVFFICSSWGEGYLWQWSFLHMQQLGGRVLMAVEFSSYAAVGGKGTYGSGVFFICSSWGEGYLWQWSFLHMQQLGEAQLINPLLHFQTKDLSTVAH